MAKKGRRRNPLQGEPAQRRASAPTKSQHPKKAITARSRRLIIKREGGPLTKTALELRDEINQALASTYVQTVAIKGNTVTLTTMESIRATSLNSRVGTFLHLIPGTLSVHLDTPVTQLLVHGLPTSSMLDTIASELTTFNTGLPLTGQPRWLTTDESRAGKAVSTIVISVTGPRAPDFVGKRLAAFSSTFRTERRLRFNSPPYSMCELSWVRPSQQQMHQTSRMPMVCPLTPDWGSHLPHSYLPRKRPTLQPLYSKMCKLRGPA